jgi:pimeloyl-ACP methyl ester carboxylesterase
MIVHAHHLLIDGRMGFVQDVVPDKPNGLTLLLVHTAGQSGVQWRHALAPLSELGYRLLVPDLPGHGHSEPSGNGAVRDLRTYAEWSVAVLDALDVHRPVAVGCSIGGKIAQDLAARYGERLTAAVSMCAEPGRAGSSCTRWNASSRTAPPHRARTGPIWGRGLSSGATSARTAPSSSPACTAGRTRSSPTAT